MLKPSDASHMDGQVDRIRVSKYAPTWDGDRDVMDSFIGMRQTLTDKRLRSC